MSQDITAQLTLRAADGRLYNAIEYTDRIPAPSFQDPHGSLPGLKEYRLADGRHLNRKGEKTFELVENGELLARVD